MFSNTSGRLSGLFRSRRLTYPLFRLKSFITLFFLCSACTSYISLIDDAPEGVPLKEKRDRILSCQQNSIATNSSDDNKILEQVFSNLSLSIEEEMIMAILQQMAVRPATTSPSSRLQIALLRNRQWEFFDYYKSEPTMPLWQGLHDLTKRLGLKPLSYYLKLAQQNYPHLMEIGPSFAHYLETYQESLSEEHRDGAFFKAGQVLKSGESVPTPNWTKLPQKLAHNEALAPLQVPVFKSKTLEQAQVSCNFDIDLYTKSVYLVRPHPGANYNIFSRLHNNKAFIVMTSVELQDPHLINGTKTLLKQKPSRSAIPICQVENSDGDKLLMLSLRGRDPGQHLYHLLQYSMSTASSIKDVEEYLAFPRHQFLYEPARMLYESSRGSVNNLESFLRMDFPIYHSPELGEVWAWGNFKHSKKQGLAIDDRSNAVLKCQP